VKILAGTAHRDLAERIAAKAGEPLCVIHANESTRKKACIEWLEKAFIISAEPVAAPPLITRFYEINASAAVDSSRPTSGGLFGLGWLAGRVGAGPVELIAKDGGVFVAFFGDGFFELVRFFSHVKVSQHQHPT